MFNHTQLLVSNIFILPFTTFSVKQAYLILLLGIKNLPSQTKRRKDSFRGTTLIRIDCFCNQLRTFFIDNGISALAYYWFGVGAQRRVGSLLLLSYTIRQLSKNTLTLTIPYLCFSNYDII